MNRTNSQAVDSLPEDEQDIDEQWEKFARDGCPDWWLMAKYTSGWLTRNIPYVPFRDRLTSVASLATPPQSATAGTGSAVRSYSAPEAELQQAVQQAAAQAAAAAAAATAAAAAPAAKSAHKDVAATPPPAAVQKAHVDDTVGASSGQAAATANTTCCIPSSAAAPHAMPSAPLDAASCSYQFKGLFTCGGPACINSTAADKPVDQHG